MVVTANSGFPDNLCCGSVAQKDKVSLPVQADTKKSYVGGLDQCNVTGRNNVS